MTKRISSISERSKRRQQVCSNCMHVGHNCVMCNNSIPLTSANTSGSQPSSQQSSRRLKVCSVCGQPRHTRQNCKSTYVSPNEEEETNHSYDE